MRHIYLIIAASDILLFAAGLSLSIGYLWVALTTYLASRFIRGMAPYREEPNTERGLVVFIRPLGYICLALWLADAKLDEFIWNHLIPNLVSWKLLAGIFFFVLAHRVQDWQYILQLSPSDVDSFYRSKPRT